MASGGDTDTTSELRNSDRSRSKTEKALQNEFADSVRKINFCLAKFNKLSAKKDNADIPTIISEIQNVVLEAQAELHVLKSLPLDVDSSEVCNLVNQVSLMSDYVNSVQAQSSEAGTNYHSVNQQRRCDTSTKLSNTSSKSSVRLVRNKIDAANVEIELKTLRQQAEIKAQMERMQIDLQASELVAKQQRLRARAEILEQYDLDEREELEQALEYRSRHGNNPIPPTQSVVIPQLVPLRSPATQPSVVSIGSSRASHSHVSNVSSASHNSDALVIADQIAKAMRSNRLPVPEPSVFTGKPLEYVDWEISFRTLIEDSGIPESDRIHYLKKYVGGAAKKAISGYFLLSDSNAYQKAKKMLKDRFGSSFAVTESFRARLNNWPKIKPQDNIGIQDFSDFLSQCEAAMGSLDELQILNDSHQNRSMFEKLPEWLANRWKRKVCQHRKTFGDYPSFSAFVSFVRDESDIVNDPITGSIPAISTYQSDNASKRPARSMNTHVTSTNAPNKSCGYCGLSNHEISDCFKFSKLSRADKKNYVFTKRLCYHCLLSSHARKDCQKQFKCKKCQGSHCTSMHFNEPPPGTKQQQQQHNSKSEPEPSQQSVTTSANKQTCNCHHNSSTTADSRVNITGVNAPESKEPKPQQLSAEQPSANKTTDSNEQASSNCNATSTKSGLNSMVVPVWLCDSQNPEHEILVYAMLDTMSDTTFVTNHAARDLNISGKPTSLNLSTMNGSNSMKNCDMYSGLMVRGYDNSNKIKIPNAYSIDSIPLDRSHIPTPDVAHAWPHLQHLASEFPRLNNCQVALLIGYDVSRALLPLQSVAGPNDTDPFAVQTPLGWCIVGDTGMQYSASQANTCHRIEFKNQLAVGSEPKAVTFQFKAKASSPVLPHDILKLLQQDFVDQQTAQGTAMSQEDQVFISTLSAQITQNADGYYTMPLPFKSTPDLPNNHLMALKRLESLKAKLTKNPELKADYLKFMHEIIQAGDAERVPSTSSQNRAQTNQWYIPHFGIYHPKKPGKIRVVFDCSAKYAGKSLNDYLIQGPDLMNRLVGVLHRFRKGQIGLMCDIQKMFHMFKVNECDRNYLRFLWYTDETLAHIAEYRMSVHLFGATSSPGCATFGLRHIAETHHDSSNVHSVMAKDFIMNDFYVDDGLLSLDSVSEAVEVISQAVQICKQGNVRLHKITSNNKQVLEAVPNSEKAEAIKDLDLQSANSTLPTERALGIKWCTETDTFRFSAMQEKNQQTTKRGILSTVASVFDPLGFLSPFILVGKQILQRVCKSSSDWDDPVEPDILKQWFSWKEDLKSLVKISIPRCIYPTDFGEIVRTELHHFSDASTLGYGQCSYLRLVNSAGQVHVVLLGAKSRVIPLNKAVTIPRAELQAAVLSAKMAAALKSDLKLSNITQECFWTDSKVALGYIKNETKRFHVYVANRVQQIRDLSDAAQWHYVSTRLNPADIASRGAPIHSLLVSCWFQGPEFLWQSDLSIMLTSNSFEITNDDPEIKATCHATTVINHIQDKPMTSRLTSFSSLESAVRAISRLQAFVQCKLHHTVTLSDVERQAKATIQIMKWTQQDSFADEYKQIKSGRNLSNNILSKLDLFIGSDNLIRVGGRLSSSNLSYDEIHPILLPKKSAVTQLLIDHCHKRAMHQGRGMTMAEIRQSGYWILGCNSVVASYINQCVMCRKTRRPTANQKMADLPPTRTDPAPPFSYIGSDCFGPFIVKENRKEWKRYGVIFTCMASRAVHIELVDDLSTDAFINALRCLISIRGPIRQLHSDQGTNYIGAANEFAKAIKESSNTCSHFANTNSFEWVTNSPYSSHMGGAWERHIRTIRSILNSMLTINATRLNSSTVRTLLYEVMAIINCRPLTTAVDDPSSLPLSPNQILTMKSKVVFPPPGKFDDQDVYSRKRWRVVQRLANQFWTKWRNYYLQELQFRQKWQKISEIIAIGDIVLLSQDDKIRREWPLARVCTVYPNADGLVRKVRLRISNAANITNTGKRINSETCLDRPIHKFVFLCRPASTQTVGD